MIKLLDVTGPAQLAKFKKNSAVPNRILEENGEITLPSFEYDFVFIRADGFSLGLKKAALYKALELCPHPQYTHIVVKEGEALLAYEMAEFMAELKPVNLAAEDIEPGAAADAGDRGTEAGPGPSPDKRKRSRKSASY